MVVIRLLFCLWTASGAFAQPTDLPAKTVPDSSWADLEIEGEEAQPPAKPDIAEPVETTPAQPEATEVKPPETNPTETKPPEKFQPKNTKATEKPRKKTYIGADIGLSGDMLVSDQKTGLFGLGVGKHAGLIVGLFADRPTGLKIRVDYLTLEEAILTSKPESDVVADSYLKMMRQNYWAVSASAEFHNEGLFGRQFFWETGLGWVFGQPSQYALLVKQTTDEIHAGYLNAESGFFLNLGSGFRRSFRENWAMSFALRTVLTFKSAFGSPFDEQTFIPLPFLFSFGLERSF